jgi:hypothetical protein
MFLIIVLLWLIVWALYWALKAPEEVFVPGKKRNVIKLIAGLFFAVALIGAFSEEHAYSLLFFTYPLAYAVLFRDRFRSVLAGTPEQPVKLYAVLFALLWIKELFVIGDSGNPLIRHMVFYAGYYVGIVLTIVVLYRRWSYTFAQVFVVGGLWGVLVEQNFAGPTMLLSGDIVTFLAFGPFVFVVYGLYLAGPYLLFYEAFKMRGRTHKRQALILFLAITIIPLLTWFLWSGLLDLLNISSTGVAAIPADFSRHGLQTLPY